MPLVIIMGLLPGLGFCGSMYLILYQCKSHKLTRIDIENMSESDNTSTKDTSTDETDLIGIITEDN